MEDLQWALKNGDLEKVKAVIKDESNANFQFSNGRFPLTIAADYGQEEIIQYLLSKGSAINRADKHGITPLLAAIFEGHKNCIKVLLDKGADKNGKAPNGSTYAECAETPEIKDLLN